MADVALSYNTIFNKVQTTLPSCIQQQDARLLTDIFPSKVSEALKHCLEISVRSYVTKQVIKGEQTDLGLVTTVTKICIDGVKSGLCSPTLPVNVLSDSFDMLTIKQGLHLFSFVEANVAIWKEDIFFSHCKTAVLRMCNDLLRRLSRSQNTVFCGRILLFLARFFPFSERSGLNLISEFNLENVTTFTNSEATDQEMKDENDTAASENGVDTSRMSTLDYTLYTKFWALQDFFRNPPQCFQKPNWKMFTVYAADVLEAFTSFKLDGCRSSSELSKLDRSQSTVEPMEDANEQQTEEYFAKYLTNQKLLDLQFSDSNFRRYVLLQMLILTQYLTSNIKFKVENLTDEQVIWVRKTDERVYALLAETPPDGPAFVNIVKHILKREDRWSDWKNDGCPEFKKPPIKSMKEEDDSPSKKRGQKRKLGEIIKEADSKNKIVMGNAEMTRLWNLCPNNLEACKKSERDFVPALETYFTPAIEQIGGRSKVKDADKLVNDSNFGWRGLRLLACRSPHFFTHSASPIATLPEYLSTMIKKLAKELPSVNQDDGGVDEEEDKEDDKEDPSVLEESQDVKEEEEEDDMPEREETGPITPAEMKVLAENLNKISSDTWRTLGKKLGFEPDELDYFVAEKKDDAAEYMLQIWVENEGEEANRESLMYTLEGLSMEQVAEGVFNN